MTQRRPRAHVTVSLDPEVLEAARRIAGRYPFSRFVEDILMKEIQNRISKDGVAPDYSPRGKEDGS